MDRFVPTSVAEQIYFVSLPLILDDEASIDCWRFRRDESEEGVEGDASFRSNSAAYQALISQATLDDFVGKQR